MSKERLTLDMNATQALVALAEGNPGAIRVMVDLARETTAVDPDAMMGEWSHLFSLDAYGIYGSRIWCLYKDVCGESTPHMVAMLRACQLGFMPQSVLNGISEDYHANRKIAELVPDMLAKVQERLPNFWREKAAVKEEAR